MSRGAGFRLVLLLLTASGFLCAQEADWGIDLRATVTGEAMYSDQLSQKPRDGSSVEGGFRSILYPTIKLGEHWSLSGALEAISTPYDPQDFTWPGNGVRGRVIQAVVGYSIVGKNRSLLIRAGQMPSAFGSFMLRYDDAENPLTTMPVAYGYYYNPAGSLGLAAIQADATLGKWDARVQFANSSPANPRSIFDKDQYANWAGGAGYTIRQGLLVGLSAYRGPYLDRHSEFYLPGEAPPRDLPATAGGVDVDWATGHWNIRGEWQRFLMMYHMFPAFREDAGYVEMKRTLTPRWFVAARGGYLHSSVLSGEDTYEAAVGYRLNSRQLIKAGYLVARAQKNGNVEGALLIQLVTSVHPLSFAWR